MWEKFKRFFFEQAAGVESGKQHSFDELQMASAGLLTTAALMDQQMADSEQAVLCALFQKHFGLSEQEAGDLLQQAKEWAEQANDLYQFTRVLVDNIDIDERIPLIEMMWEVVYADGVVTDYEAGLMRKCAGLLFVSDVESGAARKRVEAKVHRAKRASH